MDRSSVTLINRWASYTTAARRAAERLGLSCRLICEDFLRLPEELLQAEFDVVFSSSATAWIGDLDRWFANVYRALKPGGVFLLSGAHPLSRFFGEMQRGERRRRSYADEGPFFETSDAVSAEWNPMGETQTTVEWTWTLGSLLTAMAQAGLGITHVIEQDEELAQAKMGLSAGYPGEIVVRAIKDPFSPDPKD